MSKFEVAVCTKSNGEVDVFDVCSGNLMRSFSYGFALNTSPVFFPNEYVCLSQREKAGIQLWSWRAGQVQMRAPLHDKICALAVSEDGLFCAGGTTAGQIMLWELTSGQLQKSWSAHYKVRCYTRYK